LNAQELLSDLGVEFLESGHHHCRPGWIQIKDCPFCGSDNYHLGLNTQGGIFSCWKCGFHPSFKVWRSLGLERERLKDVLGNLDTEEVVRYERTRISLKEPPDLGPLLPPHRTYLLERGFDPDRLARLWKIAGIGLSSRLAWRIYIPVIQRGKPVSWTTRSIGSRVAQRYISASAEEEVMNHKHTIYGRDYCQNRVIVVEGPADAWRVGPGAGALFGTAFSTAQVAELVKIPHRFICFDSEPTAQARARDLASQLSCFPGTTEVIELDADDPGSASRKEIRLLRKAAGL